MHPSRARYASFHLTAQEISKVLLQNCWPLLHLPSELGVRQVHHACVLPCDHSRRRFLWLRVPWRLGELHLSQCSTSRPMPQDLEQSTLWQKRHRLFRRAALCHFPNRDDLRASLGGGGFLRVYGVRFSGLPNLLIHAKSTTRARCRICATPSHSPASYST